MRRLRTPLLCVSLAASCTPVQTISPLDFDSGLRGDARAVDRPADAPRDVARDVAPTSDRADAPSVDVASPVDVAAVDVAPVDAAPDVLAPVDTGPMACVDTDGDGVSDELEGAPGLHTSAMGAAPPDYQNDDSDDDGVADRDEARRNYPMYPASAVAPLRCGDIPDDCDHDGLANHRDRDSDNDGVPDREEVTRLHTDPCSDDTDGDGVSDLVEGAAMSDPTSATSRPPTGSIYVTLPFRDRMGPQTRDFDFQTRIRTADIMFLVDTTGSMGSTISAVQSTLSTTIVPGIARAIGAGADVRYGLADHKDFANGGAEYALTVLQPLNADPARAQDATRRLVASGGGDGPEAMVPAMHALISGYGITEYRGTATRRATASDCGGDASAFGWGCFSPGRVPIIVLFSDADWHNGPAMPSTNFYASAPATATYDQLVTELNRRQAYFVGIDVSSGATYRASQTLARATRTLDAAGNPIAFMGAPSTVASQVISAVTTLASGTRQDVTRQAVPDSAETRLPMGTSTTDFMRTITPLRGMPPAPTGFARSDATTFYDVAPTTVVTFQVTFFNDFYRNISGAAQLFRATINVLGRASSVLDTIQVFMIVPTDPNAIPG